MVVPLTVSPTRADAALGIVEVRVLSVVGHVAGLVVGDVAAGRVYVGPGKLVVAVVGGAGRARHRGVVVAGPALALAVAEGVVTPAGPDARKVGVHPGRLRRGRRGADHAVEVVVGVVPLAHDRIDRREQVAVPIVSPGGGDVIAVDRAA